MAQNDLTQGSILGNIRKFSLPYMMSYFLQILYGLADLFVIGQYCDVAGTTAVSNGAQIMHMFTVVIIGLAMGTTVRIARAIGAGDRENAARNIGNTFTLFTIVAIITTAILLAANKGIVNLIDTPQEAVKGTIDYLRICFIGIPFIIAYNIIASIFRGLGDSKSPMYFVIGLRGKHRARLHIHRSFQNGSDGRGTRHDLVTGCQRHRRGDNDQKEVPDEHNTPRPKA